MQPHEVAGLVMIVATLILVPGAVILLRPIAKHAGELLEQMARERREGRVPGEELERLRSAVESLSDRFQLIEERQDFTESVLRGRDEGERATRLPRQSPPSSRSTSST